MTGSIISASDLLQDSDLARPDDARPSLVATVVDRGALAFLLLATGMLLLRPADLIPALGGGAFYEFSILGCLILALPRVIEHVQRPKNNAIAAMVLLLVPAVMLSHLSHANTYDARLGGLTMAKASIFFLLVICLIDSPRRLQAMLWVVVAFALAITLLALMQYHDLIDIEALSVVEQSVAHPATEGSGILRRLRGVGVFHDPNDFSLLVVIAMIFCLHAVAQRNCGWLTLLLLTALALLGYALVLTHSRGGLLAAIAGLAAFLVVRIGWRNTLPLAGLLLPLLLLIPSRQTRMELENPEETFQTRLELWSESLDAFRGSPILGIGQGKLVDGIGQVTHNSFLHAYAEMGLLGGTIFLGAFYLVLRGLWRAVPADGPMARLRPYMLAATASYTAGLLSLSRCYTVPTQLVLALGTAHLLLITQGHSPAIPRLDGRCARGIITAGLLFLVATYVFIRLMLQRS